MPHAEHEDPAEVEDADQDPDVADSRRLSIWPTDDDLQTLVDAAFADGHVRRSTGDLLLPQGEAAAALAFVDARLTAVDRHVLRVAMGAVEATPDELEETADGIRDDLRLLLALSDRTDGPALAECSRLVAMACDLQVRAEKLLRGVTGC